MSFHGKAFSFTDELGNKTEEFEQLRDELNKKGPWKLIVIDPGARFFGAGVETDNGLASKFINCLDELTNIAGNPTVLLSHHVSKGSRAGVGGANAARGSGALTDNARFCFNLEQLQLPDGRVDRDLSVLSVSKLNAGVHATHRKGDSLVNEATLTKHSKHKGAIWFNPQSEAVEKHHEAHEKAREERNKRKAEDRATVSHQTKQKKKNLEEQSTL